MAYKSVIEPPRIFCIHKGSHYQYIIDVHPIVLLTYNINEKPSIAGIVSVFID